MWISSSIWVRDRVHIREENTGGYNEEELGGPGSLSSLWSTPVANVPPHDRCYEAM